MLHSNSFIKITALAISTATKDTLVRGKTILILLFFKTKIQQKKPAISNPIDDQNQGERDISNSQEIPKVFSPKDKEVSFMHI